MLKTKIGFCKFNVEAKCYVYRLICLEIIGLETSNVASFFSIYGTKCLPLFCLLLTFHSLATDFWK